MSLGTIKEPINLILAKGKTHMGAKTIAERREQELDVPFTNVKPPKILTTKEQIEEFNSISEKLLALQIFTELDVDALARYILSKELYNTYTKRLKAELRSDNLNLQELARLQTMQDKAYKQVAKSASELCLNISSRAKLVIPKPPDDEDDEL